MNVLHHSRLAAVAAQTALACALALSGATIAQPLPVVDVVIGNNFGHLPMFVGVEKGFFKKHGVERTNREYLSDLPALPR